MLFRQDLSFLEVADERQKFRAGMLMWFFLFLGYMLFSLNWLIMGKLESGWSNKFNAGTSQTVLEAVNYSIPLARGLATIPVAWLMVRLSHKYAVVLAMFLNCFAFFLVFSPNLTLFIIGRMLMACGGTMLIIFIQPILSRFFDMRRKALLSMITPWAYVLGALGANLIFISQSTTSFLTSNWQWVAGIAGFFTFIPALLYVFLGKNFLAEPATTALDIRPEKPTDYSSIIRERELWLWIFFYSFLLVSSVMVSNFVPKILPKLNSNLTNAISGMDWKSAYTIVFYTGYFAGFSLGLWNKRRYQRKFFVTICCLISLFLWLIIMFSARFIGNGLAATILVFFCAFWFAFFGLGCQTVILYIPHEYKGNENTRRITIFYSLLWGVGYIFFALYYFLTTLLFDAHNYFGPFMASFAVTLFVFMQYFLSRYIREPRPEWPRFPRINLP